LRGHDRAPDHALELVLDLGHDARHQAALHSGLHRRLGMGVRAGHCLGSWLILERTVAGPREAGTHRGRLTGLTEAGYTQEGLATTSRPPSAWPPRPPPRSGRRT